MRQAPLSEAEAEDLKVTVDEPGVAPDPLGSGLPGPNPGPLGGALPGPDPMDPAIHLVETEEETPPAPPEEPVVSLGHMVDDRDIKTPSGWWKVALGALLALGVAGALGYQIYYMLKRGPRLLPIPKQQAPLAAADEESGDDPRMVTITVTARDDLSGKCLARIGDAVTESQPIPCRFRVQQGKDFKLRVTHSRHKPLLLQWSVAKDRAIHLAGSRRGRKIEIVSDSDEAGGQER